MGRWLLAGLLVLGAGGAAAQALPNPVLFVAQVPTADDFGNAFSTFGSHLAGPEEAPRGGGLMLLLPDGTLRDLTAEAGYGSAGTLQGTDAIAVRDPHVHWSGTRAVFSMVVGAPAQQYQQGSYRWQLYEVSGLSPGQAAVITMLPNQPTAYNNVNPAYASDGSIIFASDRPRNGAPHLYPQQDEYESSPTVTGLWRLDPATGELFLLQHSPSGSFDPFVDSFGRVVFTRWDHLQTDQQAEADAESEAGGGTSIFGTFDFASEAAGAAQLPRAPEVFPEPLTAIPGSNLSGHRFNFFFPWTVHQDGSEEETLNHIGRHELHGYFPRSFQDDPALADHNAARPRANPNPIENTMQLAEDPLVPGRYYAIDAPEFATHASGQLLRFDAAPGVNPDSVVVEYLTPRSTFYTGPGPGQSGRYRNPLPLSDGRLVVAHTTATGEDENQGTATSPDPAYDFRLRFVADDGSGTWLPGEALTPGIVRTVSYWSPDVLVTYSGPLWELSPVEVRARPVPPAASWALQAPEATRLAEAEVLLQQLVAYMAERELGLIVVRDSTRRDGNDAQQPYNLRVPGGVESIADPAERAYDIAFMQFVQADQVRGLTLGGATPRPGRRPLARWLNDAAALAANPPPEPGTPPGAVPIAADGSVALFVPARRALSWQSLTPAGEPVVRERFWITLQPGEVRACDGCHGVNTGSHDGQPAATHPPQALAELLEHWKQEAGVLFRDGFELD